jgi:Methyltransferase domain
VISHFYETVDGWFSFREIYQQALTEAEDGAKFVEVGSWYGRSAAWMAVEIANSSKQIEFYCIDTWQGSIDSPWMAQHLARFGGSAKPAFLHNMERGGVRDYIIPVEMPSVQAAQSFADNSLDFVFIDAAHDYANVRADVRAWYPKVKKNGVIAGDDANWPGVRIGVNETIPESDYVLRNEANHWWHKKVRRQPGRWVMQSTQNIGDCMVYIPYVNNPALLMRAVRSIRPLWSSLIVIDQSTEGVAADWTSQVHGIYRIAPEVISFSQMMNWARQEAIERGVKLLVFMHSDAELLDDSAAATVIEASRSQFGDKVGVTFTNYDSFAVFNVEALVDVGPWDESFRWYCSDNDYYHRMELCGWRAAHIAGDRVGHTPSQTLHSDANIRMAVAREADWTARHYFHKWGGPPSRERFRIPYDGTP